jgi:hypothetical protein
MYKEYCYGTACISYSIMPCHTCGKRLVHEELFSDVRLGGTGIVRSIHHRASSSWRYDRHQLGAKAQKMTDVEPKWCCIRMQEALEAALREDSNGTGDWFAGFWWAPAGSTASSWAASDNESGGFRVSKRMPDTEEPGKSEKLRWQTRFSRLVGRW